MSGMVRLKNLRVGIALGALASMGVGTMSGMIAVARFSGIDGNGEGVGLYDGITFPSVACGVGSLGWVGSTVICGLGVGDEISVGVLVGSGVCVSSGVGSGDGVGLGASDSVTIGVGLGAGGSGCY